MNRELQISALWKYHDEQIGQAREHERFRVQATSIISAISAGIVGLAGVGGLNANDIPSGCLVILLSLLGVSLSLKHHQLYRLHFDVVQDVRREVDRMAAAEATEPRSVDEIWSSRWARHIDDRKLARIRLHVLWAAVPASIGLVGILVVVLAAVGVDS